MRDIIIYLLEDSDDDIYIVEKMLVETENTRYKIASFKSIDSLKIAKESMQPDVLLIDLNLPECIGLETLMKIKQFASDTPIVVLTGNEEQTIGDRAIQLGAQDYIPKFELTANLLRRSIRFARERFDLMQSLENLVSLDKLTLLYNRTSFDEKLTTAISESKRYHRQFALLFIDIDDFKQINDELGHLAGDQLLKLIASRLKVFNRSSDYIARYGGDEFVVIATNIQSQEELAKLVNSKSKALNDKYPINLPDKPLRFVHVSVSIGVSLYSNETDSPEKLIHAADKAMYKAKANNSRTVL